MSDPSEKEKVELLNIEIAIELDKGELVSDLAEKFQVTPNFVKSIEKKAVYEEHRIKKTKKIRFSEAEREILVKRMENGESLEDILSESGVEENTFRRWCKKFGVNIPRSFEQISKSEKLEIRQLLQVYGWQEISEAYNITKKSIEEIREPEYSRLDAETLSYLFELFREKPNSSSKYLCKIMKEAGLLLTEEEINSYKVRLKSLNII